MNNDVDDDLISAMRLRSQRFVQVVFGGFTVTAGVSRTCPFKVTRPAAIRPSASRREQSPARAITLAMRSPSKAVSFAGCFVMAALCRASTSL